MLRDRGRLSLCPAFPVPASTSSYSSSVISPHQRRPLLFSQPTSLKTPPLRQFYGRDGFGFSIIAGLDCLIHRGSNTKSVTRPLLPVAPISKKVDALTQLVSKTCRSQPCRERRGTPRIRTSSGPLPAFDPWGALAPNRLGIHDLRQ
jgi:hypothetical protein